MLKEYEVRMSETHSVKLVAKTAKQARQIGNAEYFKVKSVKLVGKATEKSKETCANFHSYQTLEMLEKQLN